LAKDKKLARFYVRLLHPAVRAFEEIEHTGVLVCRDRYEALRKDLIQFISSTEHKMIQLLPAHLRLKNKSVFDEKLKEGKSPFTPTILKEFLFSKAGLNLTPKVLTGKTQEPSTAYEHLIQFKHVKAAAEFISLLEEVGAARKTLSTYVEGFLEHLRPDNRFHPTYMLYNGSVYGHEKSSGGTVTGRLSCKDPAMQCMVGDTKILTSDGYRLLIDLVDEFKSGVHPVLVLTHTGEFKRIVGVYRNGVKPVYKITTRTGRQIRCTGNHPVLTPDGFIPTECLSRGYRVYITKEDGDKDISLSQAATVGGGSPDSCKAEQAGFILDEISSIVEDGLEETYDLTIDGSHSFVANGVVVHNTLPKHTKWAKALRSCFIAPPGMKFFEADYSQGELRVTACVANETNMIEAYSKGIDLHALTGATLSGIPFDKFMELKKVSPDEFKEHRQAAKAANFGLLYGMGSEGFRAYAQTGYGVVMTPTEAEQKRDKFFSLYPRLVKWHEDYKNFARTHGYIRNPLGRVRHLPLVWSKNPEVRAKAERQAINSPIQSCLSDMCLWSIALLTEKYHNPEEFVIIGMTHDSIYGYVNENSYMEWCKIITDQMANLPLESVFGWKPQLKFVADISVGPNMADLEEVVLE
jgi:DNA polymerase I-like protein with 3'-5' exonuclease and polymerase domains